MAHVIAVMNQKGGAGKTTIAVNLAAAFAHQGQRVHLVDTDDQASARDWLHGSERELIGLHGFDKADRIAETKKLKADVVVIDGVARAEKIAQETIKISDMILIPVQPSPMDIWATAPLVEMIKARIQHSKRPLKAAFVISRYVPNTLLVREVMAALQAYELPVFMGTQQRQVYPQAAFAGQSVVRFEPQGKAAQEIMALQRTVASWLAQ